MLEATEKPIYRFADVEINTALGCLMRDGSERHLRPKTFQVLLYLIERRGSNVSKEELFRDIWKETTVVDDVLVQSIKDIRRALGDAPHHPRFVKTIPKVGYRFIGTIEEEEAPPITDAQPLKNADQSLQPALQNNPIPVRTLLAILKNRFVLISIFSLALLSIALGFISQGTRQAKSQNEFTQMPGDSDKQSLVVMFFENQSQDSELHWLREGLADMLIADLSRSEKIRVLSRAQLRVLIERTESDSSEKITFDEAIKIARQTGAETLITGSFARLGEKVRIEAQIYGTETGQLITAESLVVEKPEQILTEIDLFSLKLAKSLGLNDNGQEQAQLLSDVMTNDLEAYRHYSLGVEQAEGLHNTEAIKLFEKAIARDPKFAMAHARIGYAYAVTWDLKDKGKPYLEKAFRLSDRLTEKDRLNIAAWYGIANLDFQNAAEQFRRIIAKYPLEIEAYYRLAQLLQGEGKSEEAVSVLKQGLKVDSEARNLYNGLGGTLSRLGRHDEAIVAHQRYVALAPAESNAYDSLGLTYQWAGDYESAIINYNRALELNPNFEVAIVHLANARFQRGQYLDAIELFHRYIKTAPSDNERARGFNCLTTIYLKKHDVDSASKFAKETLKLRKGWTWNSYLIASKRGSLTEADEFRKTFFEQFPSATRGSKLSQRSELYFRGIEALRKGFHEEAIANFREALRYPPLTWDLDAYEDCLANAYLELGRFDEAIAEYKRVLQLNPNYPLARFHLAQAYERKGQIKEAQEAYRQFIEIWKDADSDMEELKTAKNFVAKS